MQGSVDMFPLLVSYRLFAEQLEALDLGREALRVYRKPVPADPDFAALHSLGRHVQTESRGYLRRTLGKEVDVPSEHDHGFVGVQDFQHLVPTALLILVGVELSWADRRFRVHRDVFPPLPMSPSLPGPPPRRWRARGSREHGGRNSRVAVVVDGNGATAERIHQAAAQWPQANPADFEATGKRMYTDKASGVSYKRVHGAPLLSVGSDANRGIVCFFVENGEIVFLQRADFNAALTVNHGAVVGRQITMPVVGSPLL